MNVSSTPLHLHRFAVQSPLFLPSDPFCRSSSIDGQRDSLQISLHDLNNLPCELALVRSKEIYDLGDSVLIWHKGFGMQIDFEVSYLRNFLLEPARWPKMMKRVLNVGLAAATYLRKELPLHAGAVSLDGHFIGVLAESGTGKSTLIWSLVQSGALFGNDDLLTVRMDEGIPLAMPSVSLYPKLCAPSLQACAVKTPAVEIYPDSGEFWMHIRPDQRLTESQPLRALFALEPDETANEISVRQWDEAEAASTLLLHLHGAYFGYAFIGGRKLKKRLMKLVANTPIYSLRYPKRFDQIPRLIEAMRSLMA